MHWNIGIVGALMHRANYIVSDEKEKEEENDKIKAALTMNDYPAWMLGETKGRDEVTLTSGKRRFPVKTPYIRGLSEQDWICNISTFYKPFNTLPSSTNRSGSQGQNGGSNL